MPAMRLRCDRIRPLLSALGMFAATLAPAFAGPDPPKRPPERRDTERKKDRERAESGALRASKADKWSGERATDRDRSEAERGLRISRHTISAEPSRARVEALLFDAGKGRPSRIQGIAGARYELAFKTQIEVSRDPAADFIDPRVGPLQFKGPLVEKAGGPPVPNERVDGLAASVVGDMRYKSGTKRIVVDRLGLTASQKQRLEDSISRQLIDDRRGRDKDIVFIN